MSEMSDWIAQLQSTGAFTRPEPGPTNDLRRGGPPGDVPPPMVPDARVPDGRTPYIVPPLPGERDNRTGEPAPPDTGVAPLPPPGIPAPLAAFLRYYQSGYGSGGITPEMYQYFGGDEILSQLQQYDPNARWSEVGMGGGEGGSQGVGRRLDFDITKLPTPKYSDILNLRSVADNDANLLHKQYKWDDDVYGSVSESKNMDHHADNVSKYYMPLAAAIIGMGGPALGAALAGAGIGAGVGGTAAVTGGAAGLPAANIAAGGAPSWWTNLIGKAPRTVGPILSGGPNAPSPSPRPVIPRASAAPDPYGFDPTAFNSQGDARRPGGNDSRLVANDFSADPYGFSKGM